MFKEVADIKTADQLDLPTPEVEYHNIVAKPTEHQQDMVKALSERAAKVHSGTVDPSTDNMLKITSDGRKLGLDQRIINPMLPDEPGTKVNQCVDNILQIWRDGQPEKLTQLVFCDISTPQAAGSKKVAKSLDNQRRRNRWPLRSMRTSGRNSSHRGCPPARLLLSMKLIPKSAKRSCFPKSAPARCASC